ncbi:MAG TPA: putative selenate reductase subunit YgfK, partial [Clostridia bacterium]|nr:putative selenate reductase subunit YgfK [Clostridia bacterium]
MSDKMRPIPFWKMLDWILEEYQKDRSIFGVPAEKFHFPRSRKSLELFGQPLSLPLGPAAGPHTQLAQNIVASYLAGGRFIELKTVQILDQLEFPKPCIAAGEECYNTEWSTELAIEEALEEYIKAWFLLHILQRELGQNSQRDFVFNMSVGYDLQGIQSPKVDSLIEGLKDASTLALWKEYQSILRENARRFQSIDEEYIESISPYLCNSVTLSTMHGCPPAEIEGISKYLLREKKLHTFIKMNPTLLGYQYVQETFDRMGYDQIQIKEESFTRDLQYRDGADMLERLKKFARNEGQEFGVKLSNTLPVIITGNQLPGDEMYMSGKALYPLTINLALKLAGEFDGDLPISYSGGADFFNLPGLLETGIRPVTVASTLLKSGGYLRLKQ